MENDFSNKELQHTFNNFFNKIFLKYNVYFFYHTLLKFRKLLKIISFDRCVLGIKTMNIYINKKFGENGVTYFVWLIIAGGPAAAASGGYGPTAGTGGAAGGGPGGSWNSWNMPQNGPPPGTQPPPQPPQPNSSQPNSNSNPSGPQGESSSSVKQTLSSFHPFASYSSIFT